MDYINNLPRDVLHLIVTSSFEVAQSAHPVNRRWCQLTSEVIFFRPFSQEELENYLDYYPETISIFPSNPLSQVDIISNTSIRIYRHINDMEDMRLGYYQLSDMFVAIDTNGETSINNRYYQSDEPILLEKCLDQSKGKELDLLTTSRLLKNRLDASPIGNPNLIKKYLHRSLEETYRPIMDRIKNLRILKREKEKNDVIFLQDILEILKLYYYLCGYLFINASSIGVWPLDRSLYINLFTNDETYADEIKSYGTFEKSLDMYQKDIEELKERIDLKIDK